MHVIIAEKDINGRNLLNRMLKMEGYKVSIAESGSHAIDLMKEERTNIVLMDVFQCMYAPDVAPERKLTISQLETVNPVLLVTCGSSDEALVDFTSPKDSCRDTAFDLLPAKVKSSIMNRIQQMCSALKQSIRSTALDEDFNWQRFARLMDLPTDAYLGCRFLNFRF